MYHKTHFILGTNSYMFRHQGAIFREFLKKRMVSPTRTSGFVFNKPPEDGTLEQKDVGVGT